MNLTGAIFIQSTTLPSLPERLGRSPVGSAKASAILLLLHAEGCHSSLIPRNSVANTIRTGNDPVLQASSESFLSRGSLGMASSREKWGAPAISGDGWRCFFVKSADHRGEQDGPGGA